MQIGLLRLMEMVLLDSGSCRTIFAWFGGPFKLLFQVCSKQKCNCSNIHPCSASNCRRDLHQP